jgi:hypothetical protein
MVTIQTLSKMIDDVCFSAFKGISGISTADLFINISL